MEYIAAEQFLKQNKEVQKVFLEWWKPRMYDLYVFDFDEANRVEAVYRSEENYNLILPCSSSYAKVYQEIKDCIPLLTEGQLRKFIEDKTGCYLEHFYWGKLGYDILLMENKERLRIEKYSFEELGQKLIEAYWKVALEIAKECVAND